MEGVLSLIEKNREQNLQRLLDVLRIESVSADPKKNEEIVRCAKWLVDLLAGIGFEHAQLKDTGGHPAVYADWLNAGDDKPTIMVYGHYDVQPVDPIDKWETPPFEPTIKDGYIYGRGTSDDKAQFLPHIFALEAILKTTGSLPLNVKIFLEGEEEGGAGGTQRFVEENKDLLKCDAVVLSDTAWPVNDLPTITYGLRGIAYFEVKVYGPNRDLHSGRFGGKVMNPLNAIAHIISKLHDEDGRIAIPGIYDDVVPLTEEERDEFAKIGETDDQVKRDLEVDELWGEKGYTVTERGWARPALDVNGIWGGYMAEGSKTVIPTDGGFKASIRLVPNQHPKRVKELFEKFIKEIAPSGVRVDVNYLHGGEPLIVPIDNPFIICAKGAMREGFGKEPMLAREGASVPITATFLSALGAPSIMMSFGLVDDNIHSPNERFKLDHFYKGIVACAHFYEDASDLRE